MALQRVFLLMFGFPIASSAHVELPRLTMMASKEVSDSPCFLLLIQGFPSSVLCVCEGVCMYIAIAQVSLIYSLLCVTFLHKGVNQGRERLTHLPHLLRLHKGRGVGDGLTIIHRHRVYGLEAKYLEETLLTSKILSIDMHAGSKNPK